VGNDRVSFRISRSETLRHRREAERAGERLVGCFHSHPAGRDRPSRFDRHSGAATAGLWLIYSVRQDSVGLYQWNDGHFTRRPLRIVRGR